MSISGPAMLTPPDMRPRTNEDNVTKAQQKILIALAGIVASLVLMLVVNTARNVIRWQPLEKSPAELQTLLSQSARLILPQGPGPHPVAILLSGCDGVHDNMDLWAKVMVATGRAALILDSHEPRGFNRLQGWRAVCAGQVLTGAERAADIAVALTALREIEGIDAQDVSLLGASHGGWTVLEFMQLASAGTAPPPGLTEWPAPPESLLDQLSGLVLIYPYCGMMSRGEDGIWPAHVPGLMLIAERDRIVNPASCEKMAKQLVAQGANLRVKVIPGADHGFDQRERSRLSRLKYDQNKVDIAVPAVQQLLQGGH